MKSLNILLMLFFAVPCIVFAECAEMKIVDHGDRVEAVCVGAPLSPKEKLQLERDRQQQAIKESQQLEYIAQQQKLKKQQLQEEIADEKRKVELLAEERQAQIDKKKRDEELRRRISASERSTPDSISNSLDKAWRVNKMDGFERRDYNQRVIKIGQ